MTRLNVNGARCAALFASGLQRSDAPSPAAVAEVISRTVRRLGIAGCASQMAQEFGDHPEAAASRMRWIRQLISQAPAAAAAQPARTPQPSRTPQPARTPQPVRPGQEPARPSGWLSSPGPDVHATHPATDRAHRAALPARDRRACDVSSRPRSRPCSRPPRPRRSSRRSPCAPPPRPSYPPRSPRPAP